MSRQTVSNSDYISLTEKTFLDVQFCYSLPTKDNIDLKNCIVTTFSLKHKNKRIYNFIKFFEILNKEDLNSLEFQQFYPAVGREVDGRIDVLDGSRRRGRGCICPIVC